MTTQRRNEILVLVGLAVVVCLTVVMLGGAVALSQMRAAAPQDPTPAPTPTVATFQVPTAREAYVPALELVRGEDVTAELASAAGAWTPGNSLGNALTGRTGWTFHFYIPGTGELLTVVVDRQGDAQLVQREAWSTRPPLLEDQFWQVDSPTVVERLAEACRVVVESNPDATLETRLSTAADNGRLLWYAQVQAGEQTLCDVRVDATTGQVR